MFGRNKKADPTLGDYVIPLPSKYIGVGAVEGWPIEIKTEQQWLGNDLADPLGTYVAWMPQDTIYMELAQSDKYAGISIELSRIESKVVFSDRN